MNRIVREHYPVANSPEDLRREFPGRDEVTLTVEVETAPEPEDDRTAPEPPYGWGYFSLFRHLAKARYASTDEIVAHVQALRDEWEECDRAVNKIRGR